MQNANNNTEDRKDSLPRYFTENVYNELKKSMIDFKKDTEAGGENMNIAGGSEPEVTQKHDLFSGADSKATFKYTPSYYFSQVTNAGMVTGKPINKLPDYHATGHRTDSMVATDYDRGLRDGCLLGSPEEYKSAHVPKFESRKNLETSISSDLIECIKSPETSPNLIPSPLDKYTVKSEADISPILGEKERVNLRHLEDKDTNYGPAMSLHSSNKRKAYDYPPTSYVQPGNGGEKGAQGYYYHAMLSHQPSPKRHNVDGSINYINYKANKEVCYFNSIRPVYDEKTKSYYPNYQVADDSSTGLNHRQPMIPNESIPCTKLSPLFKFISNSQNFSITNPYDDLESYYTKNSMKHDLMEQVDGVDSKIESKGTRQSIAGKARREKKRTPRCTTSAGRPRLNRNNYSCANCSVKSTPQWRYVTGVAVCNACYMRMRKDKVYPPQFNKDEGKNKE